MSTTQEILAGLSTVLFDNADKLPEGQYLEAMNMLKTLHEREESKSEVENSDVLPTVLMDAINAGISVLRAEMAEESESESESDSDSSEDEVDERELRRISIEYSRPTYEERMEYNRNLRRAQRKERAKRTPKKTKRKKCRRCGISLAMSTSFKVHHATDRCKRKHQERKAARRK